MLSLMIFVLLLSPAVSAAQPILRQVPPPRAAAPPVGIAAALPVAPGVKLEPNFASFELFSDSTEDAGGSLFNSFKLVTNEPLLGRTSIALSFDPVASTRASNGRQTGIGDLRLQYGAVVWKKGDKKKDDEKRGDEWKLLAQYTIKIPTASSSKELGTGNVDQSVQVAYDRQWTPKVWANLAFSAVFQGTDGGTDEVAALTLTAEVQLRDSVAYQALLQTTTPFAHADLSAFQQHGGIMRIRCSKLWVGGGFSLGYASDWNPGGYFRLEWRYP